MAGRVGEKGTARRGEMSCNRDRLGRFVQWVRVPGQLRGLVVVEPEGAGRPDNVEGPVLVTKTHHGLLTSRDHEL